MSVESVTQAVSNLALAFGDDDADPGAMVGLNLHTGKLLHISCKNKTIDPDTVASFPGF